MLQVVVPGPPRNLKWGSGGRRFESGRLDSRKLNHWLGAPEIAVREGVTIVDEVSLTFSLTLNTEIL